MQKYLKSFFKLIIIIAVTILLTISFSVIGSSYIKNTYSLSNNQTNENISNFMKNFCDCNTVEHMTKLTKNNIHKNIYLGNDCNLIDKKIVSKKLSAVLKNNSCSDSDIEIILHNKKNSFSSFKINNCKIVKNESF